jgi:outer membrane phospholipase A
LVFGQETVLTLIPSAAKVTSAADVQLDLLAVNPSAVAAAFPAPDRLAGKVRSGNHDWPVELRSGQPAPSDIAPNGFARRTYVFTLPREAAGLLIVEIAQPRGEPLRTVIDAGDSSSESGSPSTRLSPLRGSTPAIDHIQRSFVDRFAAHDPVYFAYGPDDPAAKFQFSFKYRLLNFGDPDTLDTPKRTLQFGYTQRSLWDINGHSSPFYDTSYMPSLFFESLAPSPRNEGWFTWLGWQDGYQHESNGKDGSDSRSLNTLFVRPGAAFGNLDNWHLIVSPRLRTYFGGLSNNPRLKDYRGYAEWTVTLGKNDGPSLSYTGWAGKDFDHFTTQLDLTVPLSLKIVDFGTFLLIQYYSGYGESLLDYDRRSETIRVGISLVR